MNMINNLFQLLKTNLTNYLGITKNAISILEIKYTNLPDTLQIQKGAHIMFLNNTLYQNSICNGSIGIIMEIHDEESIIAAFLTKSSLCYITINKTIDRFNY